MPGSERRRAVRAHVAGVPRPFSTSTSCTAVLVVSHSCSPVVSIVSLARRVTGTDVPPWRVVRQHGQHDWGHRLASTHRLGFRLESAVLVGLLFWLTYRSGGRG
jgi:hypothetical protein